MVYWKHNANMYRNLRIFHLLFLTFLICCHNSQVKSRAQGDNQSKKKSPGKIVFDKEIHNFGTLLDGEIISYSFIYRNTGGSPVKVAKAEKSCGCIEIHYNPNPIAPGDSSTIEIILNTTGEWGNMIKEATIETSEGELKELTIGAYIDNKQFDNNLNIQK